MNKPNVRGTLYVVSTPIGNLADITFRAVTVLKEVDLIAAEDTRYTSKLLAHYDISTPTTSYHKHNISSKTKILVEKLLAGLNIAIVSDAGTPGISDPGHELINACIENNINITGIPGPNAMLNAIVLSGLQTDKFAFAGFPPRKSSDRKKFFSSLKNEDKTLAFYESPHRLISTLKDAYSIFGDRKAAIIREATKVFEEIIRDHISGIIDYFSEKPLKGEFVLIIDGFYEEPEKINDNNLVIVLNDFLKSGLSNKDAVMKTSEKLSLPKRYVYNQMLALKGDNNAKVDNN